MYKLILTGLLEDCLERRQGGEISAFAMLFRGLIVCVSRGEDTTETLCLMKQGLEIVRMSETVKMQASSSSSLVSRGGGFMVDNHRLQLQSVADQVSLSLPKEKLILSLEVDLSKEYCELSLSLCNHLSTRSRESYEKQVSVANGDLVILVSCRFAKDMLE